MADRAMAWKKRPVDFVPTFGATTVNGSRIYTAFGFRDYDTEVISAPGTGPGKIYSHIFNLALPVRPFNSDTGEPSPLTQS